MPPARIAGKGMARRASLRGCTRGSKNSRPRGRWSSSWCSTGLWWLKRDQFPSEGGARGTGAQVVAAPDPPRPLSEAHHPRHRRLLPARVLALWLAMSLRLGEPYVPPSWELFLIFCAAPAIGVATFFQLGLYRLVTRFIGGQGAVLHPGRGRPFRPAVGVARAALGRPARGRKHAGCPARAPLRRHPLSDPRRGPRLGDAPDGGLDAQERRHRVPPAAHARKAHNRPDLRRGHDRRAAARGAAARAHLRPDRLHRH